VLSEPGFADKAASELQAQGQDALPLADPMTALDPLERAERLEVLVTSLDFAPGKPNGIALGRMARLKRPGIRVLFVGPADLEKHTEGIGTLMPSPVTVPQVVEGVLQTLDTAPDTRDQVRSPAIAGNLGRPAAENTTLFPALSSEGAD
jgi:hypothetical protein